MNQVSPNNIALPITRPYPLQRRIIESPKRYVFTEASTKSGKTVACLIWIITETTKIPDGGNIWWIAPIYSQAQIAFNRLRQWLVKSKFPITSFRIHESELKIQLHGRFIWFKGSDDPDKLYGEDVHRVVIDEASRCKSECWPAVRSTLTATQGHARIIGNVTDRHNWAYRLSRRAESGDDPNMEYVRIIASDAVAAGIFPQSELDDARKSLEGAGHGDMFRALYFCEPMADGGNPFGFEFIRKCVGRCPQQSVQTPAAFGVDLGKSVDYTWVFGLDANGNECFSRRWQSDWDSTFRDIRAIVGDTPALIDSTGVGDPVAEELMRHCPLMESYKFTAPSKQRLMEHLRSRIHQTEIGFCDPMLIRELESFEYELRAPSNRQAAIRYSAPPGAHDDGVVALALAAFCLIDPEIVSFNIWEPRAMIVVG